MFIFTYFHPATLKLASSPLRQFLFAMAIIVAGPLFANQAQAALNCAAQPSCAELGYAKTIAVDCPADQILRCPFDTSFKKCVQIATASCPSGWTLNLTSSANCSSDGSSGWTIESVSFSDTISCGKCICQSESTCTWTASSAGANGTLSNKCCNGNYKTCTNNCKNIVSVPANATGVYTSCTACGSSKQIISDFNCNTGYSKSGSSCVASACPSGYSTAYQSIKDCKLDGGIVDSDGNIIGAGDPTYWTFSTSGTSGTKTCGKCTPKCTDGYSASIQVYCQPNTLYKRADFDTDHAGCTKCIKYNCDDYYTEAACRSANGGVLCVSYPPTSSSPSVTEVFVKPLCWRVFKFDGPGTVICCPASECPNIRNRAIGSGTIGSGTIGSGTIGSGTIGGGTGSGNIEATKCICC